MNVRCFVCVYFCGSVHIWCDTVKLVPVNKFLVQNATTHTVQARWTSVRGATGYRLTWQSPGTVDSSLIVHIGL